MNVQQLLIFCLSAAILDSNLSAAQKVFIKLEGEVLREQFNFPGVLQGSKKFLCRNECNPGDVLIETEGNRAVSDRFTIRYDQSQGKLHVVVTGLRKEDTGRYRVGIKGSLSSQSFQELILRVKDLCDGGVDSAEPRVYRTTEGGEITVRCSLFVQQQNRKFLCRDDCKNFLFDTNDPKASSDRYSIEFGDQSYFNVTIGQVSGSDSGTYRCGVGRRQDNNACRQFEIIVAGAGKRVPLVVASVSVVVVLLVVSLLLVYRWKKKHNATEYMNTGRNARNTEVETYDDCDGGLRLDASTYQELDVQRMEENLYSSLEILPNSHR
ncbi:polymeric immunoglobulin receptor-like isoform X2 [Acanthochromis polyacanthus]|uniref:polymeric immunoglobulin receptor-like isoform X2 n=1 Tax=Acanthochromis polyacanthus TaxID=80966 RepID=UPI0022342895|nr:polymeric immunoglobulin receptor-like isoform X2 [Acanthochromis polyacanthus]